MRVLVIGSGVREHALVWKISQSKLVDKIFCSPGNGGIVQQAECIDIKAEDIQGLLDFARKEKIDLTVVGPEAPLAQVKITEAIPKYASGKEVKDYNTAFSTKRKDVKDGEVIITLKETPVFVEER